MRQFRFNPYSRTNQVVIDGLIFASSLAAAYAIRFEGIPPAPYCSQFLFYLPCLVAVRLLLHWNLGIYRLIWRYVSLSDAIRIGISLALVTGVLFGLRLFYPDWGYLPALVRMPLSVIAMEFLLALTVSLGARGLRRILYQRRPFTTGSGTGPTRVLLIGAGSSGARVAKELESNPDTEVIGFLDDDPRKIGARVSGAPVLGPTASLPSVVAERQVNLVIICVTRPTRSTVRRLWGLCDGLPVQTKIVPSLEDVLHGTVNLAALRDLEMDELLGRETVVLGEDVADVVHAYRSKRILITGAGGSIGSELARQLFALEPAALVLLDKEETSLYELSLQLGGGAAKYPVHPLVADVRFPERLKTVFDEFRPEVVFHAAAYKHVPLMEMNPCEAILNNVVGTRNLVEQCAAAGVARFVLISTDKAVKPASVLGASKRICEMIVQANGRYGDLRRACVRFGNVMGSRGSVIPLFQRQIARGGPVTVTHPDVQRYFMTIPEAVRLVIQAGTLGSAGEVFILDMGDPIPIIELARDLIELNGLRPGKDIKIEVTQLRPGERIKEELVDRNTERIFPTRFERIWVVKGEDVNEQALEEKLDLLEEAARRGLPGEIRRLLGQLCLRCNAPEAQADGLNAQGPAV
jgi:FlaA1/EpsC-like NDP-sugar epimerase